MRKMMNSGVPMRKGIAMGMHDRMYAKAGAAKPKARKPSPKPKGKKAY